MGVFHPILQKVMRLATCDVEDETGDTISLFWTERNRALSQYSKIQDYQFNPRCWVVNKAGSDWSAINNVYGEEGLKRVKK